MRYLFNILGLKVLGGSLDITIGKESKILKAIVIYPEETFTKKAIISKFGSEFIEIESWQSMCSGANSSEKPKKYPIMIVYPSKGVYVMIGRGNKVNHIGYLVKCPDAK